MSDQVFLGVDLGAESGRVMAGLFDGNTISLDELHRFPNQTVTLADSLRWDVLGLWRNIEEGLSHAGSKYGDQVLSVGADTWGVDYVLLSKSEEIVGTPFHYRDQRNFGMMDAAFRTVSREDIFRQSGLQFMEINTLYQLLATQKYTPELLENAHRLLMMPDFMHWCLSGSDAVEFTNATTSQCYHPVKHDWSFDMLNAFNLPTEIFPQVVRPGAHLGKLRERLSLRTGLPMIDVVAPATHDTGAAVAAVPTNNTGSANWAYISSGTWSLMGVEVQDAILSDEALAANVTNEGGVDGTWRLLKNIMGLWLVQGCRRSFERKGKSWSYADLAAAAAQAPKLRAIIDPDHPSFLNPEDMCDAISQWCLDSGQTPPDSEGAFVRCALESLALKYARTLKMLESLTGTPVNVIHVVGGGCQNELLNQLTADACGVPVFAGPVEATVLGNVLIQARANGVIDSLSDIRDVVRNSTSVKEFQPERGDEWAAMLEFFDDLVSRNS